jgi:hypothetical protein
MIYGVDLLGENTSAFEQMRRLYDSFNQAIERQGGQAKKLSFWGDFFDYAENGYVHISPTAMAFAKPCRDEKGEYWFIRAGVGPLPELLAILPSYLPRIMFCRNNEETLREYRTERLLRIAVARMKTERQG